MWKPDPASIITAEQKAVSAREKMLASYKSAFDAHLDAVAQSRQYDNRLTIIAYASSTNAQWAAEAQAFIAWRDAALSYMFDRLAEVNAGGTTPSVDEFVAGIAPIEWLDNAKV
ncbi:hypothetical protein GOC69_24110 [Sinorhizobium medicae]|nr:hypothetical protein [Sinorhizobium medicae]MDX0474990.1 hypothetical protein [Sinorhizobium medicae]